MWPVLPQGPAPCSKDKINPKTPDTHNHGMCLKSKVAIAALGIADIARKEPTAGSR